MEKLLFICTIAALAGSAMAQGSAVTLFGTLDANATHTSQAGASRTFLSYGGHYSSLLGLPGLEELGGGLSAGFWLESSLANDTGVMGGSTTESGASRAFFNRRSTVSLSGPFGEFRLGRDYAPSFWNDALFDPFGTRSGSVNM